MADEDWITGAGDYVRRRARLRSVAALGLVAFAFVLTGCDEGSSGNRVGDGEWAGSISDSAGIRVVANSGAGLWERSEAWRLVEEMSISDREIPRLQFGQIQDVAVDSRGRILVLDDMTNEFHVFSPRGEHLRSVGGEGGGPGEFTDPFQIFVLPGDSVLVPDLGNARASVFGPDGSLARTFPVDALDLAARRWGVSGEGDVIARRSGSVDALLRLDARGEVRDTLARFAGPTLESAPELVLLSPIPVWGALPAGGVAYGHTHAYRITIADEEGATRLVFSRPLAPSDLSETQRNHLREGLRATLAERAPPETVEQLLAAISFHEELPLVADVLAGPEGTLWIQRATPPEEMRVEALNIYRTAAYRSHVWDVFDSGGRYLGAVDLAPGVRLLESRDDRLYGVRLDEFDVPRVVRYRIESGPADGEDAGP